MHDTEVTAFRLHAFNWIVLAIGGVLFWVFYAFSTLRVTLWSVIYCYGICLSLGCYAWWRFSRTAPRRERTTFVIAAAAQVILTTVIFAPATYIAASYGRPFQDAALHAADQAVGLNWRAYLDFVNSHPWLGTILSFGYRMIRWPIFAIPLVLGLCGHGLRLNQFVLAYTLALAVTTVVSAFVPAVAAYAYLGLTPADYANIRPLADSEHLSDLYRLREGTFGMLDLRHVLGIVTFPSFHAASCLLFAWAFWPVWWMRPVALVANGLMLASTPIDGGHYFVDVLAGLGLAAVSIWVACLIGQRLAKHTGPVSSFDLVLAGGRA
jgi:membrane-associated phospholipid phosphatase